jgi:hypothetical protein
LSRRRCGPVALVVALAVVLGACSSSSSPTVTAASTPTVTSIDPSTGMGVQVGPPPWPAPVTDVAQRAVAAHLVVLKAEGTAQHIHAHLDVIVDGNAVAVPASIGIDNVHGSISPLHTHDTSGIVHIESPDQSTFTLGQFFTEWGVRFGQGCVAGSCAPTPIEVVVNGTTATGDPTAIVFHAHDELAVVVGTPPGDVPQSFNFPSGY